MNATERRKIIVEGIGKGLYAEWILTRACNFDCHYCVSYIPSTPHPKLVLQNLRTALKQAGDEWTINLTGGEPMLYPGFAKLCQELTKDFFITINTNLTVGKVVREVADKVSPERLLRFSVSVHMEQREQRGGKNGLEPFIENVLFLKARGFNVRVVYVVHPALIGRYERDYQYFLSRGISLVAKPFKGTYKGKAYSGAFSESERALIQRHEYVHFYPFCLKGLPCNAGKTFIHIGTDGIVRRCAGDSTPLGSLAEGFRLSDAPKPCRVYKCPCSGTRLVENNPYPTDRSNVTWVHEALWRLSGTLRSLRPWATPPEPAHKFAPGILRRTIRSFSASRIK